METSIFYVVSSRCSPYCMLSYSIENAKLNATRMATEFGDAEITEGQLVKGSFKQLFQVKPTVEFIERKDEEKEEGE